MFYAPPLQTRRNDAALAPGWSQCAPISSQKCPPNQIKLAARREATGGSPAIAIGVSVMQLNHPQPNKRRRSEPSLWVDVPTDDAFSLLENALREDAPAHRGEEHKDQIHLLLEENARLRRLLAQLSDPIS
jgi:hypothetical protein